MYLWRLPSDSTLSMLRESGTDSHSLGLIDWDQPSEKVENQFSTYNCRNRNGTIREVARSVRSLLVDFRGVDLLYRVRIRCEHSVCNLQQRFDMIVASSWE